MLGIRIDFLPVGKSSPPSLRARFSIGNRDSSSSLFLTNPLIRSVLQKTGWPVGTRLGGMSAKVLDTTLQWGAYNPFQNLRIQTLLGGLSIAELLEIKFLVHAKKMFPRITTIRHSRGLSGYRILQLRKRGLPYAYAFQHGLHAIRVKVGRSARIYRPGRIARAA